MNCIYYLPKSISFNTLPASSSGDSIDTEDAKTDEGVAANATKAVRTVVAREIFIIDSSGDDNEEPVSKIMSTRCALPRLEKRGEYHFVFPQQLLGRDEVDTPLHILLFQASRLALVSLQYPRLNFGGYPAS